MFNRNSIDSPTPVPAIALALALGMASGPASAAAPGGDQLWRFYADFSVTLVEAVPDLSGNGGVDLLVGSTDDSLYLVEGRGPGQGVQLWAVPFRSTLSSAIAIGDVNGDGRMDVAGGDELGFMQAIDGATGAPLWKALTFGTVLSALSVPDVDGDGVLDVVFGSENDTVYCFSGKPGSLLGKLLWSFHAPAGKIREGRGGAPSAAKRSGQLPDKDGANGINSLALLRKGADAFGIVAGTSNDTVYCLPLAGGAPRWKVLLPGDAWQVAAFPDQDGDGIDEVLVACGANAGLLLKGSDGAVIWSHPVSLGAVSVSASADMDGDGKPDALVGDGGGRLHCVPGNSAGPNVAAAWTYDFGDTSTIHSIAALGDVDADGRADCAVGTSSDLVAVISGKGTKSWSVNLGGTVLSVTALGDLDGNGSGDVAAGTMMGFAAAFEGFGTSITRIVPDPRLRGANRHPAGRFARRIHLAGGAGLAFGSRDAGGRHILFTPGSTPRSTPRSQSRSPDRNLP